MPSLKIVYFSGPGRAEPTRLSLALGGHAFEVQDISFEQWGTKLKPEVAPRQLPLLYVDGEVIGQSLSMARYAAKISSVDGKPLYPVDPLEALRVDEFCDMANEIFPLLTPTFEIADQAEKEAARGKLMAEDGAVTKWVRHIDGLLGKSKTGFAVGDSITLADIFVFTFLLLLPSGMMDGIPRDCLDKYENLCAHTKKIASIPRVAEYYKDAKGLSAIYKQ